MTQRLRLYAGVCFAQPPDSQARVPGFAFAIWNETEEGAKQEATKLSNKEHPRSEGWFNHQVSIFLVPNAVFQETN